MPVRRPPKAPRTLFLERRPLQPRTEEWRQVGLGAEIDRAAAQRARGGVILIVALIVGVLILFDRRRDLFPGLNTEVRIATVALLVMLGWALARSLGRGLAAALWRRLDPATAGTVGSFLRLLTIVVALVVALAIAGLQADTLAVGGAVTAVAPR